MIETGGTSEHQTKLIEESREERLSRLFDLEMQIQHKKDNRQRFVDSANALKNEVKALEKDKVELLNLINSGQGTFIPVATNSQMEEPEDLDDMPTDAELAEFEDPAQEPTAGEENQELPPADESGEADAEPISEGETEILDEIMSENMSDSEPETSPEATPWPELVEEAITESEPETKTDSWALFNVEGTESYGFMPNKKSPRTGAIYTLPISKRQNGKVSFVVRDFSLNQDAERWEVYCDLLTDAERIELENQPSEGVA
jgi:hypothetical protein